MLSRLALSHPVDVLLCWPRAFGLGERYSVRTHPDRHCEARGADSQVRRARHFDVARRAVEEEEVIGCARRVDNGGRSNTHPDQSCGRQHRNRAEMAAGSSHRHLTGRRLQGSRPPRSATHYDRSTGGRRPGTPRESHVRPLTDGPPSQPRRRVLDSWHDLQHLFREQRIRRVEHF